MSIDATALKRVYGITPGRRFHHLSVVARLPDGQYKFQCVCGRFIECGWKTRASCGQCGLDPFVHRLDYKKVVVRRAEQQEFWKKRTFLETRSSAQNRGIRYDLTYDQFLAITVQNCHYCGAPPFSTRLRAGIQIQLALNGMDRVDCRQGYGLKNVVPCCRTCNIAKAQMSREEFLAWIKRVYAFNFKAEALRPGF